MEAYDYVIVGAGSAGCALAAGLVRDGRYGVLLLEAGGSDRRFWIKLPIGYGRTFFDPRINWKYTTEADPGLRGRSSYWPQGKVLGGSSSINALVYCRGLPSDFEDWQRAGAAGWDWQGVRPHYESIERRIAPDGSVSGTGPLSISDVSRRMHPTNRHYLAAAREVGLPITDDFNGPQPEGVGHYWLTTERGLRCSSADAFLRPALGSGNLTLLQHAHVQRVLFDGRRASAVEVIHEGERRVLRARREVILCSGGVNSAQLLQLSGIGPGGLLQSYGIDVRVDNPNVGGNLQDHLAISYYYRSTEPTLNNQLAPWWGKAWAGLQYALLQRGPLSVGVNQYGGFVRSDPRQPNPDLQLYFTPFTHTTAPAGKRPIINPDPFQAFLISFQIARPVSRGRVDIRSPDSSIAPRIEPGYLSAPEDLATILRGAHLLRRMVQTTALRRLIAEVMQPDLEQMDDAAIIEDFRTRCGTVYHPVSTCAMGRDPRSGVLDSSLRVFGVDGLRVACSASFPNITSGNTNAPALMVGHKAAALILSAV